MGEITIRVPQRIRKTFDISNKVVADKMLKELEKSAESETRRKRMTKREFAELSEFMTNYRLRTDLETRIAIETAEEWRKRWDR